MAPSLDSMFLFEIVVEDLKSFIDCKEFIIKSKFADVFTIDLKDPNESKDILAQTPRKRKCKKKTKVRCGSKTEKPEEPYVENNLKMGQSVLLAYNIDLLISNMMCYPMELSLWRKETMIGSTHIPWSQNHIDYLKKTFEQHEPYPVAVDGQYNVFDELTSKRMATIKLNIKLRQLKGKVIKTQFKTLSDNYQQTLKNDILTTILSKDLSENGADEPGIIKTLYSGRKKLKNTSINNNSNNSARHIIPIDKEENSSPAALDVIDNYDKQICKVQPSLIHLIKSDTNIEKNLKLDLIKSKSLSTIRQERANVLNYIFGDTGPYGNRVYCVGYVTVESVSAHGSNSPQSKSNKNTNSPDRVVNSAGLGEILMNATPDIVGAQKCNNVECNEKSYRVLPPAPDDRILFDLTNLKSRCCDVTQKLEEVVGGMKANMQFGPEPCMCTCECTFGFTKRTTYCATCGGYENPGEDIGCNAGHEMPFPCPIFHKTVEKGKSKTLSTSGSDGKRTAKGSKTAADKKSVSDKVPDSEKETKKSKKKKKDERFKFNYGYKGIPPQIGHSHCAMPCTGTLGSVPKHMGWLWNAENVPGMKFRPMWRPGATSKHVVRLLKIAKNPGESKKKRRKDGGKKKRPLKRPLLTVHKKDGEFTVTMETMKVYSKQRSFNQYPYEDKPVLTYTIGRTDEENRQRQIKKDRKQRRLERAQRQFIQSAFKDMCQDICIKTYQQALAILPDAENPDCPCYPAEPGADRTNLDVSCSCSEDESTTGTDTDSDEWIVEFTPPNATFYPTFKGKKVSKVDNGTQYTYLDYKVKLLDRFGNPVPRFFKGPDGKQQCSDLGGFWTPDKKWMEINIDGYIGPDERWAPNLFTGPNGETVDCDTGKFQATNGAWLVVGVDGYIDIQGKWKFYPRRRESVSKPRRHSSRRDSKKSANKKGGKKIVNKPSEAAWSCLGDVTPKELSKMGILGHGQDRKLLLDTLKAMMAQGQDVRIPEQSKVPRLPGSMRGKKRRIYSAHHIYEQTKCKHPTPSDKGIVAVDAHGNKTYFRLQDYNNKRPQERLVNLTEQGISLNSFHLPCFRSFINSEIMKKELYEKLQARYESSKGTSTQGAL